MLDDKKIAELKAKHKDLQAVETPNGSLVFRKPSRAEYDRWFDKTQSTPGERTAAARELAQSCLVFPDRDGFIAILDEWPALLCAEVLSACTAGAGLQDTFPVKKL
jgi:hypothetical protein